MNRKTTRETRVPDVLPAGWTFRVVKSTYPSYTSLRIIGVILDGLDCFRSLAAVRMAKVGWDQ